MLHIKQFTFSPFQENTFVLYGEKNSCWIVDPGCYEDEEKQELKAFIASKNLVPKRLINTHCHLDHVFGNKFVSETYGLLPQYDQRDEPTMKMAAISASMYGIPGFEESPACEQYISDGDQLELDGEAFELRFCPGHAPGHLVFIHHASKQVIGGDVLFRESIGRTDLPGGNHEQLIASIKTQLFTLDGDYTVFPGHGPSTSIAHEKKCNPFLK
ncbi:MAG: MBL fold metallo-hydrolase [Salibacteraceae bacterium]